MKKPQSYDAFVDKFKPRHTSDDTHTPPIVHGDYVIFLARKGDRRWRISTHYKSAGEATKAEEIKQWLRSGDRSHLQGAAK